MRTVVYGSKFIKSIQIISRVDSLDDLPACVNNQDGDFCPEVGRQDKTTVREVCHPWSDQGDYTTQPRS